MNTNYTLSVAADWNEAFTESQTSLCSFHKIWQCLMWNEHGNVQDLCLHISRRTRLTDDNFDNFSVSNSLYISGANFRDIVQPF